MPSPFPGMDPYLEGDLWTSVHASLGTEIARQLVPKLRPRYVAVPVERFIYGTPQDVAIQTHDLYPDAGVIHKAGPPTGVGLATLNPPLRLATVVPTRVPQVHVEIRDTKNRRLVTAIEILSPANKRGRGRREYLAKRRSLLLSTAHLMEVDLLRNGRRVPMRQRLPAAPYFVLLSRVDTRPIVDVWPIALREALPEVPVPLLAGDPDVGLNLQQALANVYDLGGFDLLLDYSLPPDVPLSDTDMEWAEERLRAAAVRSG